MKTVVALLLLAGTASADPVGTDTWAAEHVGLPAALGVASYAVARGNKLKPWPSALVAVGVTLFAGAVKETWDAGVWHDAPRKGLADFGMDTVGAVVGVGLALTVDWANSLPGK